MCLIPSPACLRRAETGDQNTQCSFQRVILDHVRTVITFITPRLCLFVRFSRGDRKHFWHERPAALTFGILADWQFPSHH